MIASAVDSSTSRRSKASSTSAAGHQHAVVLQDHARAPRTDHRGQFAAVAELHAERRARHLAHDDVALRNRARIERQRR